MAAKRKRAGRPLKPGPRHPCGKLVQDARGPVLAQRIARGAPKSDAAHAEWENPLGRALKAGHISREAYEAGVSFRALDADYRRANGIAPPHTRASDWAPGGRLLRPDDDPEWADRIKARYNRATQAMMGAGNAAWQEVQRVVIFEREVWSETALASGLAALMGGRA